MKSKTYLLSLLFTLLGTLAFSQAPIFTSSPVTSVNAGETYSYTITTSDPENDAVTITAPTKPAWLSLTPGGNDVTTYADGSTIVGLSGPRGVAVDASGNLYVASTYNNRIFKLATNGTATRLAATAAFDNPIGVAVDGSGNVYIANEWGNTIQKIAANGDVTTLAGSGSSGYADGTGTNASFNSPQGVAVDASGNVYVSDFDNHTIRKITPSGVVTTFAGSGRTHYSSNADATGTAADMPSPRGIAVDGSGNVYVAADQRVRKITPAGLVTTLAGSSQGNTDGTGSSATFQSLSGLAVDASGNVYVSSLAYHNIRKITPSGVVTTLAGPAGSTSGITGSTNANGTSATFRFPFGLAVDASGNVYVGDESNTLIRKVSAPAMKLTGDATGNVGSHSVVLEASDGTNTTQQSFTVVVSAALPTVSSSAATSITAISATLNGSITVDGGATITERGFVYSLTSVDPTPTVAESSGDNVTKVVVSGTTGVFTQAISNLTAESGYSFAAYATNSVGTTEGSVVTFSTPALTVPTITFIDINKTYGDSDFILGATSNSSGAITYSIVGEANGTSVSGTNNVDVSLGNAGTVIIRATQAASGIYSSATKDITLTISAKSITVTANAGQTKVYGDADPTFDYTISSGALVDGDAFSGLLSRDAGESVGNYAITVGTLSAGGNYNVTFEGADFSITPKAITVAISRTSFKAGETAIVTFTFSGAVTGFTNDDLTIPNGTLSTVNSEDGDVTFTSTYTPSASIEDATNMISLNNSGVTYGSVSAGNGTSDSENFMIDTKAPTATVAISDASIIVGETATVTISFSEAVTGFTNDDLTITNGTLEAVSSLDGDITFTATFTATSDIESATNVVTLDVSGVADVAGNAGSGTADSENFMIDTKAPTATVAISDASIIVGETATVTISFSEAVTGFTNDDLTIPNGTLEAVSSLDGDITFTATYTPSASIEVASNMVTLDVSGVADVGGNAGSGTTDSENFTIDTRPTWSGTTNTDWATSSNWVGEVVPSASDDVVIADVINNPTIASAIEVNSIEIATGAVLTISSNSLKVNDATTLDGNMTVASGASFIPLGTIAGSGAATVNRNTTFGTEDGKYSVVGSPVTAGSTASLGNIVYSYDETVAYNPGGTNGSARFTEVSSPETMTVGDAYFTANTGNISFTGTPNSGNQSVSLIYSESNDGAADAGFNLVSNPYTAAISYTSLMSANSDIDGTIYLWDDGDSKSSQRTNSDYVTANSMGAAGGGSFRTASWDGYIRSTQGFFVKASSAGTLNFTPSMMDASNNSDAGFFRKTEPTVLRLSISSESAYNDILIGFAEGASLGIDRALDAHKIKNNGALQFYSRVEESILAIQALPASVAEQRVGLGFDITEVGTYTIRIEDLSSYDEDLLLIDNLLNEVINLSQLGSYTFQSNAVVDSKRFELIFAPNTVTASEELADAGRLWVYQNGDQLNVKMNKEVTGANVKIFTLAGAQVGNFEKVEITKAGWNTTFNNKGLFIISIQTGNEVFVQKFINK